MARSLTALSLLLSLPAFGEAQIDAQLANFARSNQTRPLRVVALLDPVAGPEATPPRRYDRPRLMSFLKARTERAVRSVQAELSRNRVSPRDFRVQKIFPSSLSMSVDVTPAGLLALAQVSNVVKIYANGRIAYEPPVAQRRASRFIEAEDPYQFEISNLNQLIRDMPQITGQGVLVGHIDTGVDGKHPALQGKIAVFFDAAKNSRTTPPFDTDSHGTHTAGTILGGTRSSTPLIGVAPDAKLVSAAALDSYEDMLKGMEFMLDPDGNPSTNDQPRLVSNSWNTGGAPDQEPFYRAISTWEAAGILPLFSAGNAGPNPKTITPPHEHPEAFAIANAGRNFVLASRSSRGPGIFKGQETQKPDIAASGTDILSSVPGGGYELKSGTSMATPQVAGTIALMLQANPQLTPVQIRKLLIDSSVPLSDTGTRITTRKWNPNYGLGHLDILAAVKAALALKEGRNPFPNAGRFFTMPDELDFNGRNPRTPTRTINDSWQLVREHSARESAGRKKAWLSLRDLR